MACGFDDENSGKPPYGAPPGPAENRQGLASLAAPRFRVRRALPAREARPFRPASANEADDSMNDAASSISVIASPFPNPNFSPGESR